MKFLVFLLSVTAALAAVDGTVNNGTSGKPQAGLTVTLFKLGQGGPEFVATTKTDAEGRFRFDQAAAQVPQLLETVWQNVTYSRMLPPGMPTEGVGFQIFDSSKTPGTAQISQHIVMLEPAGGQLNVSETFLLKNDGKLTWHDAQNGTLRFNVPEAGKASLRVMATAPQGMPLQRSPGDTATPGLYMLNFPIKPGETRIDVTYMLPDASAFSGKTPYKDVPTRIVVPNGVTVTGDGLSALGNEPTTQAAIYETRNAAYAVKIEGSGSMRAAADADAGDDGPSISQIMPPRYEENRNKVLAACLATLALGFFLLYRRGAARGE